MEIENAKKNAQKFRIPLFTISILAFILGFLKLFGSVALCIVEVICAILLFIGVVYKSH